MRRVVTATEARVHFGELMRRVVEGRESVVVERGGKPQVVILSVRDYEELQAKQKKRIHWRQLIDRSREQIRADLGSARLPSPEEMVRRMRKDRDAELLDLR